MEASKSTTVPEPIELAEAPQPGTPKDQAKAVAVPAAAPLDSEKPDSTADADPGPGPQPDADAQGSQPSQPSSTSWQRLVLPRSRQFWNHLVSMLLFVTALVLGLVVVTPAATSLRLPLFVTLVTLTHSLPWTWPSATCARALSGMTLLAFWLAYLGVAAAHASLPALLSTVLIIVIQTAGVRNGGQSQDASPRPAELPLLPGPAQRQGPILTFLKFTFSQTAALFNPLQSVQLFRQLLGALVVGVRYGGRLPNVHTYVQQTDFCLPVQGQWFVAEGTVHHETPRSLSLGNHRFAWDLLLVNDQGGSHRGEGIHRSDYFCYGKPVLAPAVGVVVEVRNDVPERGRPGTMALDWRARDIRGNYCVIQHSDSEYSLFAHLIPGSLQIQVGQTVAAGAELGRCGQSGHASEPHLHMQFQDRQDYFTAATLPVVFSHVVADHELKTRAHLQKGQMVAAPRSGSPDR